MNISLLKYRKYYFTFSGILVLGVIFCLIFFGLNLGIDFVGGSLLELKFETERLSSEEIRTELKDFDLGDIVVQPTEEKGVIIRMKEIDITTKDSIVQKLRQENDLIEMRFESIGPVIGRELKSRIGIIIILVILGIVFYIAFAFRKISWPMVSWQYGISALIALFHDVLITLGIFSVLGFYYDIEITIPIVTALPVILGYSINDTVVIFDRIRENLAKRIGATYEETVNKSLNQTFGRSINTSLTTLFVLFAIFFFGGETLKYFALALIIGISFGAYSSIFLATPFLVSWLKWKEKRSAKRK